MVLLPPSLKPLHCLWQGFISGWNLWWAASVVLTWVLLFLSLFLSVCLYPCLAFTTLVYSRGRRNSHTRHQVESSNAPLYFPVLPKQHFPLCLLVPRTHSFNLCIQRQTDLKVSSKWSAEKCVFTTDCFSSKFLVWTFSTLLLLDSCHDTQSSSHIYAAITLHNPAAHGVP